MDGKERSVTPHCFSEIAPSNLDQVNLNRANKREIAKIYQSYFSRKQCSLEQIETEARSNLAWGVWGRRKAPSGGFGGQAPHAFQAFTLVFELANILPPI